jgi:hypothetical protein
MSPQELVENRSEALVDDLILFLENSRFFVPSPEMTDRIGERLVALRGQKPKHSAEGRFLLQQKISEQLYFHLRTWADSGEACEGKPLALREILRLNFWKSIGLGKEEADFELLEELASEASAWIGQLEHFQAGWGEIISAGDGSVILRAISDERKVDGPASIVSQKHGLPQVQPKKMAR